MERVLANKANYLAEKLGYEGTKEFIMDYVKRRMEQLL